MKLINRPEYLFPLFGSLNKLRGIAQKTSTYLAKLAVIKPIDLLYSMPAGIKTREFIDYINEAYLDINIIVKVKIIRLKFRKYGSPSLIEVSDSINSFNLIFFNAKRDWLSSNFPVNEERIISGKLERFNNEFQIIHPEYVVKNDKVADIPKIETLYSLTKGISQKLFNRSVKKTLDLLPKEISNSEWISDSRILINKWECFNTSLTMIHNPRSIDDLAINSPFRLRLAYDDLFSHQICLAIARSNIREINKDREPISEILSKILIKNLPFELTKAQNRCIREIRNDLLNKHRMFRLLQGDVGSGKTLVAFISMLFVIENKGQCALMVPTDLLAQQHYKNLIKYTADMNIDIKILSGKTKPKTRQEKLEKIRTGEVQIVIGTHALFQKDVHFKNLQLAVIDEQHKFGVKQRLNLIEKGNLIDILVMTATPIPRTLQLANYGDMDISIIDEKPLNRKKIDTAIIPESRIESLLKRLKIACEKGQQAYWVCPLIEEGENSELIAIERRFSDLKIYFPNLNLKILHGKMPEEEKSEVMESFAKGEVNILLATTVIEVGIDVAKAAIMIIEGAERFGLAQLHQLRGRVGRGEFSSSCVLIYSKNLTSLGKERLEILRNNHNGFEIAEEDLKIRGGGNPLGFEQSGVPKFRIANLEYHADILSWAQEDARSLIEINPDLEGVEGNKIRLLLFLMGREQSLSLIKSS